MHICIYTYIYTSVHAHIYRYVYLFLHIHIHTRVHFHLCFYIRCLLCVCVSVCARVREQMGSCVRKWARNDEAVAKKKAVGALIVGCRLQALHVEPLRVEVAEVRGPSHFLSFA